MTIESPESYGEAYWKSQVDAAKVFEEDLEKSIKPFLPNIFADVDIRESLPFDVLSKIEGLLAFPDPGLGAIGGRFFSEIADSAVTMVMNPALRKTQYAANRLFANVILTPDQASTLFYRRRIVKEDNDYRWRAAGYGEMEQKLAYDASRPFPAIPELFRWARYHGEPTNAWSTLFDYVDFDPRDYPKFEWLSHLQYSTDQITALYKRGTFTDIAADLELTKLGWLDGQPVNLRELSYSIPNAMLLIQGNLFRDVEDDKILTDISIGDIHPEYAQKYLDAVLTKPGSTDLTAYHLRQENELSGLDKDLRRIGIHPAYFDVYKTLADRIPPLNDIITMAVREAFTPSVAARFGQYEDFPPDFERYAAMQGMGKEWSQRYWAAHWSLPSITQGFNMLHRGIIDKTDLVMLLKAQDVMPFWRDKLIAMAYKPFTRIDVKRMYKEGVLDSKGVYEAYLELGYNENNAEKMTQFVITQTLSAVSKFTSGDIINAYANRMIDKSETGSLLRKIGTRSEDISYILSTADYKREWKMTDSRIRAVRNIYKRGEYTENDARSELLKLNLPNDQVSTLMEQWWYEQKEDQPVTWTKAETLKFFQTGLINEKRTRTELNLMGYDTEHIDIYLRSIKSKQEPA